MAAVTQVRILVTAAFLVKFTFIFLCVLVPPGRKSPSGRLDTFGTLPKLFSVLNSKENGHRLFTSELSFFVGSILTVLNFSLFYCHFFLLCQ